MDTYAGIDAAALGDELERHLDAADAEIDAAVASAGDPSAVLGHLDLAARHARRGFGRTAAMWAVHPDASIRAAAGEAQTRLDAWRSATFGRRDLFGVLAAIDADSLEPPDARRVTLALASARANGAHLDDDRRGALAALQARASALAVEISQAFVTNLPVLDLTPDELAGMPADEVSRLEAGDAPGTKRVRVEFGTRDSFLTNVRRRDVRERYWRLLQDRGLEATLEPMRELFRVRREIARLAGYASWADMRTVFGALRSVDAARAMLADITGPAAAAAETFRNAAAETLSEELLGEAYQPWDQYRAIRALSGALGADAEALRPYLPLDAVQAGLFRLVREVFGIRVEEGPGGLGWHADVRTLHLIDDATGEVIGICLLDPWARDGKMAGTMAFMELLEADGPGPDGVVPPAVTMLVTMIPPAVDGGRAMVGVFDAGVLFHEFGHVLDFTLGSRRAATLDDGWWGSDWVEGPSFFLEFWARVPEVFATYARDPQTGAAAPAELVDTLSIAQALEDVPYLATYVQRGLLDLAVHGPEDLDLDDAWRTAHAAIPLPEPSGAFRPFPISMVAGGYDAAIYGVPYALAIRDDLLDTFGRDGWLSPTAGRRYVDEVLRPGPFLPPTDRLGSFLGHPVSVAPLAARMARAIEAAGRAAGAPHLSAPDVRVRRSFAAAMDEFRAEGRGSRDDRTVIGRYVREHAQDLASDERFGAFAAEIRAERLEDTPRPDGFVPDTELWWVQGDEFLGRIGIRHRLTPFLLEIGGHIGYDVRPTARRRGYATEMLRRALRIAHDLGIDPALVTCDVDNVGSRTVIERNGGVLEDERRGKLRYWVPTSAGVDRLG